MLLLYMDVYQLEISPRILRRLFFLNDKTLLLVFNIAIDIIYLHLSRNKESSLNITM